MEKIKNKIPVEFFQKNLLLPLDEEKIGICEESNLEALEDLRLILEKNLTPILLSASEIQEGLRNLLAEDIEEVKEENTIIIEDEETQDLLGNTKDAPIIRLVNSIFLKALNNRASDIHIEPYSNEAKVRIRVDGILHEILSLAKIQYQAVSSRLKVMSKLNLAERRLPQDGRMRLKAMDAILDVRVSTVPTLFGERIALRLLDSSLNILKLDELGLEEELYLKLKNLIHLPHGFILLTGPTGSGKTTTLYAILSEIISPFKNIITIEDPVEYQISGISQIQVNPKINLNFSGGLRSIVRQDPDIIMVGEIRDAETADISIHAALTGHLVLSTLHTNDTPTAISRLVDIGIEPFLISSSLKAVLAQRLARKLCQFCKTPYPAKEGALELGINPERFINKNFYKTKGCQNCLNTGYSGRIGIFELMIIDEEFQKLFNMTSDASQIRKLAKEKKMPVLIEDGIKKILSGLTTVEEVLRAVRV